MELDAKQLQAAHQLGEAILRFFFEIDRKDLGPASGRGKPSSNAPALNLGDDRLLRAREVADLLALSRSKVYDLMYSGRLPSVQIDGARRFKLSDVKKLIE